MKKRISAGLAAAAILILILDGQAFLQSASYAVTLCLRTVIPSLFPFLFLCSLITAGLWGESARWLRPLSRGLGIPKGAESLLISAFLGGYPAGAQIIGTCYREGRLSRQDAQRLLPLCNNAGPAFLFGMVSSQFPLTRMAAALWLIQILSVLFAGTLSAGNAETEVSLPADPAPVSRLLDRSVRTMGSICGWIILFQILCGFLDRWFLWLVPREIQVLVTGLLELSSGCCRLQLVGSVSLRFLICAVQLSFGGLCVTMQTVSVMGKLSAVRYLQGKLLQTGAALLLSLLYLRWGWAALTGAGAVIFISLIRIKNNCRFSLSSGV